MQIHTVRKDETLESIAEKYGINVNTLKSINTIPRSDKPVVGQELLIMIPTRTYTAKGSDTSESISSKFGVKENELISNNPYAFCSGRVKSGEILTIKYRERIQGYAATNGYFFNGCTIQRLNSVAPLLNYVTVASAVHDNNGISVIFDGAEVVEYAKLHGIVPLLRLYDTTSCTFLENKASMENFTDSVIALAKSNGYRGLVLAAYRQCEDDGEKFLDYLISLRKKAIGEDLLLFTEIDEKISPAITDVSDGSILTYDKMDLGAIPKFTDGELAVLTHIAGEAESSKIFIDLPSLALCDGKYYGYGEAIEIASLRGSEIKTDPSVMVCEFEYTDRGRKCKAKLPSLKNLESKLKLVDELGFLGISFDIMRAPAAYLMAFNSLFKTAPF